MTNKTASTDYPILPVLAERWSPYGFADKPVAEADLRSLFEAARAAATDKVPEDLRGPLAGDSKFVGRIPAYPNGCAAAEIEIAVRSRFVERCTGASPPPPRRRS